MFREIERETICPYERRRTGCNFLQSLGGWSAHGQTYSAQGPYLWYTFYARCCRERYQERYWHDREFDTVEGIRTVADLAGFSLTTLAVAWVLSNPIITAPIIGASPPQQLADNFKAVEVKLDDSLKQKLDDLTAEYRRGDSFVSISSRGGVKENTYFQMKLGICIIFMGKISVHKKVFF